MEEFRISSFSSSSFDVFIMFYTSFRHCVPFRRENECRGPAKWTCPIMSWLRCNKLEYCTWEKNQDRSCLHPTLRNVSTKRMSTSYNESRRYYFKAQGALAVIPPPKLRRGRRRMRSVYLNARFRFIMSLGMPILEAGFSMLFHFHALLLWRILTSMSFRSDNGGVSELLSSD